MTLTGINHINHMAKARIRKSVALSMLLLVVVTITTGYVIKNATTNKPSIYLNKIELASRHSAGKTKDGYSGVEVKVKEDGYSDIEVKIIDTLHLPKSLDGQYLSALRLGLNNELYIKSHSLEERRSTLVKVDKNTSGIVYSEVVLPHLSNIGGVSGYDIDERGYIYVAHYGGSIAVVESDGRVVSIIHTGDFRPTSLVVDKEHRIWVVGALMDSPIMRYVMKRGSQDNQIRVYSVDGSLLKIAAGGVSPPDIGLGRLVYGEEGVSFVSHYDRTALYKFDKNMQLSQAKRFPFDQLASYKHSGATDTPVDQSAYGVTNMQADQGPLVVGIINIDKVKIWYGAVGSGRTGTYGNGFIGVTDMQDNPLTPCIMLPVQFRAILGADSHGNIYVVDRSNGGLVLHKVGININRILNR